MVRFRDLVQIEQDYGKKEGLHGYEGHMKFLLERFKRRELTPMEFKRARWRHTFINELKRYYDVGIVTNGLYDSRIKILQMGLCDVFSEDTIFHAEHLGYRKPDPEIYLAALQHFGKEPKETLFIGDSWRDSKHIA